MLLFFISFNVVVIINFIFVKTYSFCSFLIRFYLFFQLFLSIVRRSLSKVFCKKGVLKNFAKFPGKELRVTFLIKLKASGLLLFKKRLWYGCFPVNFAIFPKTPCFISQNIYGGYFCIALFLVCLVASRFTI